MIEVNNSQKRALRETSITRNASLIYADPGIVYHIIVHVHSVTKQREL